MQVRLQKILSEYGVASRRAAEKMIEDGRVTVNGTPAAIGKSADPDTDVILIDGNPLPAKPGYIYLMLNKPRGYVTTLSDEKGRRSVSQLVAGCGERVFPIGRLDMDSEGLLLMTNDGELANLLMHPSNNKRKTYIATVEDYTDDTFPTLQEPIEIDGRKTEPALVTILSAEKTHAVLEFRISEGRNRQIRRLCERAGYKVTRLRRTEIDGIKLGMLKVGKWRNLTAHEIARLKKNK